jgi:hypothetical protein
MATAIETTLLALLNAAAGEESVHSAIGRWRQRVGELIGQLSVQVQAQGQASHPPQAPASSYVQVGYATTDVSGAAPSGPGQPGLVQGNDVVFTGDPYGVIPYSESILGAFTLSPNRVYRLSANFQLGYSDPGAFAQIWWVDANTNMPLRNGVGSFNDGPYDLSLYSGNSAAELLLATGGDAVLAKLRVLSLSAGTVDILYGSNALVHEI